MKARITFVLLVWLVAFAIVMGLFLALGSTLTNLPLPVRALVISGVLSIAMTQLGIPLIMRLLRPRGGANG